MKKYIYTFLAIAITVSVFLILRPTPITVETVTLSKGPFAETLSAEGKIRSRDKQTVFAFATGTVQDLKVKVGDLVKKGQVLTLLDWDFSMPIKSPIDGVISKIYRESSGPIIRGEPIFEVSSLNELEVVVDLLTPDAIRLSANGEAKLLNWGGEEVLDGKIMQISRAGTVKTSALGVEEERTEVKVTIEKVPQELKEKFGDSYHVDILFLISNEVDVLTVPLGALFKSGEDRAVYTVDADKKATMRIVKISKRNDRQALLVEGLQDGEKVILFPGDKIREGSLVKD